MNTPAAPGPKRESPERSPPAKGAFADRHWPLAAMGAALLTCVLVYFNSLDGSFVWDDRQLIVNDRAVKSWSHISEVFTGDFFERNEDDLPYGYYRPVTTVTYLLDFSTWGLDPRGYHLTNVVLHAVCTLLVGANLLLLGWGTVASGVAAVLFAAHPIHTENVAWIAGRTDILAFMFCGIALLIEIRHDGRPSWAAPDAPRSVSGPAVVSLIATCAFALGLLAKEMSVVFVGWLALIERVAYRRPWPDVGRRLLPYLTVLVAYAVWRFWFIRVALPGVPRSHSLFAALLSLPSTVVRYLTWLVWPGEPSAYVQNPYLTNLANPQLLVSAVLLIGVGIIVWRAADRVPQVFLATAMLAVSFMPILNLLRVAAPADMGNVMAERFCYFPSFPFVALVGLGAAAAWQRAGRSRVLRAVGIGLVVIVVGAASMATVRRNQDWHDELTFLTRTLERSPTAVLLWGNLASYHLREQNLDAAGLAIERAAAVDPENYAVLSSRALLNVISGRAEDAIPLQERIVANAGQGRTAALNNLAYLYRITGRTPDAQRILDGLVADGRGYADVYFNLAEIARARGSSDDARRLYRHALQLRPHDLQIGGALADLEHEAGQLSDAEGVYRGLAAIYPNDPRVLNNLALILHEAGHSAESLQLLERVVRLQPDYANGRINYAQLLADSGRATAAVMQLEEAIRLAPDGATRDRAVAQLNALRSGDGDSPR